MPASNNHRSSSSSSSSTSSRVSRRIHTADRIQTSRSLSVPSSQQYVIIITNNSEIVRQPSTFRFRVPQATQTMTGSYRATHSNHLSTNNNNYNDRELILNSLLRLELTDAIHQYMSRTRRSFPIYYIFDTSNESEQQSE